MEWEKFSQVVLDKVCRHPRCAEIAITGKPKEKSEYCQKCFAVFNLGVEYAASKRKPKAKGSKKAKK